MTLPFGLNLLDVALLTIMGLFAIRGAFRGLVDEIAGLVGVVGGVWLAGRLYPQLSMHLAPYIKDPLWADVASFGVILCAVLAGISILARLMHKFMTLTFTDWLNHMAGCAIGLLKGLVICAIMVALLQHFLADAPFVSTSRVRPYVAQISAVLVDMLPPNLIRL